MRIHATRITGSLSVSGSGGVDFTNATAGVSGSFRPSDVKTALPAGTVSGSAQTSATLPENTVSSSAQIAVDISGSFTSVSSSLASRLTTEESEAEGSVVSSSAQIATDISGSFTSASSSLASRITTNKSNMTLATASVATNESNMTLATASIAAITASVSTLKGNVGQELNTDSAVTFATVDTGQGANELYDMDQNVKTDSSPTFANTTVTGTLTATEVHTQFVSASITKTTGSNVFGDEPSDRHQFTGSAFISSSITAVTGSYGRVEATNYTGDGSALTGIDIPTAAAISGSWQDATTATGSFGALAVAGKVTTHLLPTTDDTYDLGSATFQWRDIYTGDFHLNNTSREEGNEIDGTKGNWTIQEGREDLYLLNNETGKKYKFNLTEIE